MGVSDESEMLYMKGKTSQKWSASDFNFGHDHAQSSARELGGSLSFCHILIQSTKFLKSPKIPVKTTFFKAKMPNRYIYILIDIYTNPSL